ncbi:hypothetical protein N0X72_05220 [Streptomyces carpaticus]|uniref:hypothetical protein n=1 Tax=Streptomyces TaxID=1883 RepID=UPI002176ECC8|nr:hypothetical protein [Streptomyces ginkgonis]UWM48465.1 hypothetical protein N0X72_05220 [Streptomyces carpaticus]
MTSRTPREPRLHLVPEVPAQPAAAGRRTRPRTPVRRTPTPPRGIPPRAELARQARALLADTVRVARWAQLTGSAPDTAADRAAPALRLSPAQLRELWGGARLAGLVEQGEPGPAGPTEVRGGWRLRAWDSDDTAVLRGWVALFEAWSLVRPAPGDADTTLVAEIVTAVPQLLAFMQLSGGPVAAVELLDLLRQRVTELREGRPGAAPTAAAAPPIAPDPELVRLLGWALDALSAVGALTLHARYGDTPARARLTPLGGWAMWTKLEQICIAAQSPAGNIEQSAVGMLRGCAGLTPGPARAEYRAWLAARPTGPAVDELLEAARGEDALIRSLAFDALRTVGAPARTAVRAAADEPVLRPYALLWLAEHEGEGSAADPEEAPQTVLTRQEATWLWVDTASAAHEHGSGQLLLDHLDSAQQPSIPELLAEIRTCGHPHTVQVLLALAAAHPDAATAKRVRRAAFQVHNGGA